MTDSEKRFLSLPLFVSCLTTSRAFNKLFESYLLCLTEISDPQRSANHLRGFAGGRGVQTASAHLCPILAGAFLRSCRTSILHLMLHVE
ncbi:hypothetical protein AMECASPLE_033056, partial [Ameca splendens]